MIINKICDHLSQRIENGELSNADLVQLIELCGKYLNLKTISEYAKKNNMSYNGVKKARKIVKLFGNKYVIDND